jgi:hypothetical protein
LDASFDSISNKIIFSVMLSSLGALCFEGTCSEVNSFNGGKQSLLASNFLHVNQICSLDEYTNDFIAYITK